MEEKKDDKIVVGSQNEKLSANLVPFHIQYSGPANTKDYFTVTKQVEVQADGTEVEVAYFRGCKLVGVNQELPHGYKGYLMNKNEVLQTTGQGPDQQFFSAKIYNTIGEFDKLIIYGHDQPGDAGSQWATLNEWQELSDIIHS